MASEALESRKKKTESRPDLADVKRLEDIISTGVNRKSWQIRGSLKISKCYSILNIFHQLWGSGSLNLRKDQGI